jgi:hypothetical protein
VPDDFSFSLEMVLHMKAVAELKTELTVEERNLLSVAFKVRTTAKLWVECEKKK